MTPREVLETAYSAASDAEVVSVMLLAQQREWVEVLATKAERQKAVLAATLTSLVKKIVTPEQDVRLHKVEMPGGYSGRSFDTQHVTSFLHEKMPSRANPICYNGGAGLTNLSSFLSSNTDAITPHFKGIILISR